MEPNTPPPGNNAALIVAAGRGVRAGGTRPKQYQLLGGITVLEHAIRALAPFVGQIVVVRSAADAALWAEVAACLGDLPVREVMGGQTRDASVRAGLAAIAAPATHVLIHDGARPLVSQSVVRGVLEALQTAPAAAPALPVTDALWHGAHGLVTGTQDRSTLFRAQTPQGFAVDAIRAAHAAHPGGAADDVEVARAQGLNVVMTPGDPDNLKVTTPDDFARAARIIAPQEPAQMDIRLGNGFDVHRFGPGDHVTLCGIDVPHDRGLQGHSDADVAWHAITDAIYGALAEGDIGQHFPPSDPQWKGAASGVFLRHAVDLAQARGYRIGNVDCTLICEFPKIGPQACAMRARTGAVMGLDLGAISVKATTSERLGFTGRGEGIACIATVTLIGDRT